MVELRKRPAREEPPPKAAAPKKTKKSSDDATAPNGKTANPAAGAISPSVGDTIALGSFGGEIETHNGEKVTLAKLVEDSKAGVVLFTYPKASTPGCKQQTYLCCFELSTDLMDKAQPKPASSAMPTTPSRLQA